jgi:hypothetical protein
MVQEPQVLQILEVVVVVEHIQVGLAVLAAPAS